MATRFYFFDNFKFNLSVDDGVNFAFLKYEKYQSNLDFPKFHFFKIPNFKNHEICKIR